MKHPWLWAGAAAVGVVGIWLWNRGYVPPNLTPKFANDQAVTVRSSTGTFTGRVIAVHGTILGEGPFRYDVATSDGVLANQPEENLSA